MDVGKKLLKLGMLLFFVVAFLSPPGAVDASVLDVGPLEIESPSAYLMDATTGMELFSHNAHERRPPASMTKVVTMALVFDAIARGDISLEDRLITSARASGMGGSQIYLSVGEEMTVHELIMAVAISSANDASVVLAEHLGGSVEGFAQQMNDLVAGLGLENSNFVNPHGLDDPEHYSTAHDMSHLSRYLVERHPQITDYTSIWTHWLREDTDDPFWLTNTNRLLQRYPGMDGLKTGKTDGSMWCLSATALRDNTRLIATVMGAPTSDTRFDEISRLLDAGFATVETVNLATTADVMTSIRVWEGTVEWIDLVPLEDISITVPRGESERVAISVTAPEHELIAPIYSGEPIGHLAAEIDARCLGEFPLTPARDVERSGILTLFIRTLRRLWIRG